MRSDVNEARSDPNENDRRVNCVDAGASGRIRTANIGCFFIPFNRFIDRGCSIEINFSRLRSPDQTEKLKKPILRFGKFNNFF